MLLPFTYPWIIKRHLSECKNILDIGCGDGSFMAKINTDNRFAVTGVDLFEPYLEKARNSGAYEKVRKKDVRKIDFKSDSFDGVHTSQLIEHLEKKEGVALIRNMEKMSKKRIVIGTPNGHFPQDEYDKNILQKHKSSWDTDDFTKLGYTCYGQAMKFIYGEEGLMNSRYAKYIPLQLLFIILSYILSPLAYFFPRFGAHIIAVKSKK